MGILDQLKQEAALKQEQEPPELKEKNLRDKLYQSQLLPALQNTFNFMKEVVEYLNYLDHSVTIEQYSDRYPQFGSLCQQDYKIYTDDYGGLGDFNRLKQVNIRFCLHGEGKFSYSILGQSRIEQEIAFLTSRKIPFEWKQLGHRSQIHNACFTVSRKIPIFFKFEADYEHSNIRLLILNHENFNLFNKVFSPEELHDALFDQISRYMLRKDHEFYRLEMSIGQREAIRQMSEQTRQERALQMALAELETANQPEHQATFLSTLKNKWAARVKSRKL